MCSCLHRASPRPCRCQWKLRSEQRRGEKFRSLLARQRSRRRPSRIHALRHHVWMTRSSDLWIDGNTGHDFFLSHSRPEHHFCNVFVNCLIVLVTCFSFCFFYFLCLVHSFPFFLCMCKKRKVVCFFHFFCSSLFVLSGLFLVSLFELFRLLCLFYFLCLFLPFPFFFSVFSFVSVFSCFLSCSLFLFSSFFMSLHFCSSSSSSILVMFLPFFEQSEKFKKSFKKFKR